MLLNWTQIWLALHDQAQKRRGSPLADPLEGEEWRPFLWVIPLIAICLHPREGRRGIASSLGPPQLVSKPRRMT
jgi:hypothetical protein